MILLLDTEAPVLPVSHSSPEGGPLSSGSVSKATAELARTEVSSVVPTPLPEKVKGLFEGNGPPKPKPEPDPRTNYAARRRQRFAELPSRLPQKPDAELTTQAVSSTAGLEAPPHSTSAPLGKEVPVTDNLSEVDQAPQAFHTTSPADNDPYTGAPTSELTIPHVFSEATLPAAPTLNRVPIPESSRRPTKPAEAELTRVHLPEETDIRFQNEIEKLLMSLFTEEQDADQVFRVIDALEHRLGQHDQETNQASEQLSLYERAFTKLIVADVLLEWGEQKDPSVIEGFGKRMAQETVKGVEFMHALLKRTEKLSERVINFWPLYVNRLQPIQRELEIKEGNHKTTRTLRDYEQPQVQDVVIKGDGGGFCIEGEGDPYHTFDFCFYLLRALVYGEVGEGTVFHDGKTHNLLPERPDGRYAVSFINASTGKAVKILVSMSELGKKGEDFPLQSLTFRNIVATKIAEARKQKHEVDYFAYCGSKNLSGEIKDIAYNRPLTYRQVEKQIANPLHIDVCDLKVVLADWGEHNVEDLQNSMLYFNGTGSRFAVQVPLAWEAQSGRARNKIAVHTAHWEADAQPVMSFIAEAMDKAAQANRLFHTIQASFRERPLPEAEVMTSRDKDAQNDQALLTDFFTHGSSYDRKVYLKDQDSVVEVARLDWSKFQEGGRLSNLIKVWKDKFEIRLSSALLETLAMMIASKRDSQHFLVYNKHHDTLVPVLTILSRDLQSKIAQYGQREQAQTAASPTAIPELPQQPPAQLLSLGEKLRLMMEIAVWQLDKNDAESTGGYGAIPAMSVLTEGFIRQPVQLGGRFMNPRVTKLLTETGLSSNISPKSKYESYYQTQLPPERRGKFRFTTFTTAFAFNYREVHGTLRVDDNTSVLTHRFHTKDRAEYQNPDFEADCQQALAGLVAVLEEIANTIPRKPRRERSEVTTVSKS